MSIERQLAAIKSKQDLHAWIDQLPDDSQGVLLLQSPDGCVKWYEYGSIDVKTTSWILSLTQHHLMECVFAYDKRDDT